MYLLRLCHGEERRTRNSLSTGSLLLMSGMLSGFDITIFFHSSVPDPSHFGTDPDPRIRTFD
jgi:hypothetical protein